MNFSRVHYVSTLFTAHSAEEVFLQRCFKTQTRLFVCFLRCRRGRSVPRVQRRRRPSRARGRLRLADVPATVRDQYSDVSVLAVCAFAGRRLFEAERLLHFNASQPFRGRVLT